MIIIIIRLVSEFEHPGVLNLTHVAVDRGSIYLAGGNVLYQLDQVNMDQMKHQGMLYVVHERCMCE